MEKEALETLVSCDFLLLVAQEQLLGPERGGVLLQKLQRQDHLVSRVPILI